MTVLYSLVGGKVTPYEFNKNLKEFAINFELDRRHIAIGFHVPKSQYDTQ